MFHELNNETFLYDARCALLDGMPARRFSNARDAWVALEVRDDAFAFYDYRSDVGCELAREAVSVETLAAHWKSFCLTTKN